MNRQLGKMTLWSLIATLLLALAGFMAFKYIGSNLEKKQIKKEVYDTLGIARSGDKTNADFVAVIEEILAKKGVEILSVTADTERGVIRYSFSYRIETDYFLFKRSETIEVMGEIESYG
ncbi:MAG: hypothetical protein MUF02_02485 [Acidobacteria bacterium]|jgi:hypothetical protein|nr:hypothetical protein [Acidobacteriota bacterium]